MNIIEAIILGIIQGLTEFIPVSSSGHLILADKLFGLGGSSLAFDVALHGGTLMALIIYFWRDIIDLIKALFVRSEQTNLARLILIATVPAVISGMLLESYAAKAFRSTLLVSFNLIFVAGLMLLAEHYYKKQKAHTSVTKTNLKQALTMGFAQAAAVVPGVSRSGGTITAGLFVGMDRVAATRFSFLLGIPIIFGAFLKEVIFGAGLQQIQQNGGIFAVGIITALVCGLFAISFLLKYLGNHSLNIFAYYRIALGLLGIATVIIK